MLILLQSVAQTACTTLSAKAKSVRSTEKMLILDEVSNIYVNVDCLQSAFSLKIRLVLILSSAITNHNVIHEGLRPDEKRRTVDSFVVNKPSVSPETE